jgi:hypothetical protein
MSQRSASDRAVAARKRSEELEATIKDIHVALPHVPPAALSALAVLVYEAYDPSHFSPDLGTHVSGSATDRTPRSNRAAVHELERWQAAQRRWAATIMGTDRAQPDDAGNVGRIERLVYGGKHSSSTPLQRAG